jgi:hypothetical protein
MGYTHGNIWNEEIIANKIFEVMKILNIRRMPTALEVKSIKHISGLDSSINKYGGYIYWSDKLNLQRKIKYCLWKDEEIKNRLYEIMSILNISRMPTRSEIIKVENNQSLHNAISRGLGYYQWADMLNLKIKPSETDMGISYQKICKEHLTTLGYKVNDTSMKAPYDLIVNNNIRIDVKSGCAYDLKGSRVHTFGINKKFPSCDIYIIYALNETGEEIERNFIIPSKYLNLVSLSIGENSKYNKYINKWDYIDKFNKFYETL